MRKTCTSELASVLLLFIAVFTRASQDSWHRRTENKEITEVYHKGQKAPEARFSKDPVTLTGQNQILVSKSQEK